MLVLGLIAAVAAVAFPFAPVHQPEVTYRWSALDGATAIPLLPYQPVELTAAVTCAAARVAGGDGTVLLSTVPLRADPRAASLAGLTITTDRGLLRVESAGVPIAAPAIGAGDCTVSVSSRYERTVVAVDGTAVAVREGDVRPAVAGLFTDLPRVPGVDVALTTDTRFQTSIGAVKAAIGVVCVLALLGMLLAVRAADGRVRAVRIATPGWWRPRPVDGAVGLVLTVWWIVGGITVDDGYISGIVRSVGSNGMVGNVYRWLNAPEAPFSWFYELYHAWSQVSASTVWMRLPSTLLGLLCWVLLSRFVLPRLGRCARRPVVPWLAAVALLAWWVPYNLGLRPEPWVAVGMLAVFAGIERALATRRVLPLAIALILAGATTAVTPAGLVAFMPVLAAAGPLVRLLRARTDLHVAPILALLVAAPAAALLLMAADQSMAAILEATRVRRLIGGGQPWHQEIQRYATLLEPDGFQGAIGRRAPVLLGIVAAAGAAWTLARRDRCGIAAGPARRLVLGFVLGLAAMTLSPTKWTQHFGDLAGYGAAVLVLGMVAWSGRARVRAGTGRVLAVGWGLVLAASALVLAGRNLWPFASDWYSPVFSAAPPRLGGVALSSLVLVGGALAVAALLARSAWLRAGGAPDAAGRRVPAPAWGALVVLVAVVALQVGSLAAVAVQRPDGYTLASDAV
ncbi:MAG: arabinosyltransferase domain-containing protein, partial [Pseudonocardia sp.]|nr:arabinosyltransferase domain-containing protein [Pseudonocardia sp.]